MRPLPSLRSAPPAASAAARPGVAFALLALLALFAALAAGALLAGCGGPSAENGEHGDAHEEHDEHGEHGEEGEAGIVALAPEAVERAGIETAEVALRPLGGGLTATGQVGWDERRIAHVAPRLPGRVQRVAAELGDAVAAGQPLVVIDSVELGAAKAAFLRARAHHDVARLHHQRQMQLHEADVVAEQAVLEAEGEAREAAAELAAAAENLSLYGLDPAEVAARREGAPPPSLYTLRAPFAGRVVAKEVAPGELVTPERTLFTVADLDRVWVWVDLYERDLARVRTGQPVAVTVDAFPGETIAGTLAYLGDQVAAETRTLRARVDLPNPGRRLRPGMFARVRLDTGGAGPDVTAVPAEAVERPRGDRGLVFVDLGGGRFERREVTLGRRAEGWVEIVSGVRPGERVVTRGAFLLASQAAEGELGGGHHH